MTETLVSLDQSLFLFLNGLHTPFLDPVMYYGTRSSLWIPLYLLLAFLTIRKYRWNAVWIILVTALMVTASDQLSNLVKETVARPRPGHEPGLTGVHHVYGYAGGAYGFWSGHASTNLAVAVYMVMLLQRPFRFFPALMFGWAFFMAYTRIYLGVHYPGDILAGWIAGATIGFLAGKLACRLVSCHPKKRKNARSGYRH